MTKAAGSLGARKTGPLLTFEAKFSKGTVGPFFGPAVLTSPEYR